jgi:Mg2+-importing ATPase
MIDLPPIFSAKASAKAVKAAAKARAGGSLRLLQEVLRMTAGEVLERMEVGLQGLEPVEAQRRLEETGPNLVSDAARNGWLRKALRMLRNPLVLLLTALSATSFATGDLRAGTVIGTMVVLGVLLRWVQESRAGSAAEKLKAMIRVTATAVRGGVEMELQIRELVPGDLVRLSAGDMVPADLRLIATRDLFVSQAALTGEALPVEKFEHPDLRPGITPLEANNLCYLGTSVESGAATGVVLATGASTYLGQMSSHLEAEPEPTRFDRGVQEFTWLMIAFMGGMVPLVFLTCVLSRQAWHEAFFFSLAIAVGLTPEMLPMIVSVSLSKGAMAMARRKVVVKQISAIQNLGAMDVLCTDKTGTLTMDQVILERHCDVMRHESEEVFRDAYLIAHFQTGLRNVLDRAVLAHRCADPQLLTGFGKADEIPFDFGRRMMSVVVESTDGCLQLLTKGAPEAVFPRCTAFELNGRVSPIAPELVGELMTQYEELSSEGFRVLAVAHKPVTKGTRITREDETGLILKGYVAFLDPPKDSAAEAIAALQAHGIEVKVLTGDNALVTRTLCRQVGIDATEILEGNQIELLDDTALSLAAERTRVFARLSPAHKQRILQALQKRGHVVGFLGDGINDALALHAADVGISVDSAVDIAKAAAGIILLEKNLHVLDDGVIEGRKVFVNILKYLRMGASSNFGNMFSVLGACAFLPFVPMAPIQILTNNLLYDFSQVPIPTDTVSSSQTERPQPWDLGSIRRFVLCFGPVSSLFDYTTFFFLLHVLDCAPSAREPLFQTGWFVESLITQTLVVHVIRTHRIPFFQGTASWQLNLTTAGVIAVAVWLPISPLAPALGFVALPGRYWPFLIVTVLCYLALAQTVKARLLKAGWI